MTDHTTKKPVARRVQEHRTGLRKQGYVRAEVVLPKSVRDSAQAIAGAQGAGLADTLSALVQYGLTHYQASEARASTSPAQGLDTDVAGATNSNGTSPIAEFFRQRKEQKS